MGKEKNTTAPKEKNAKGKGPKQPSRVLAFLRGEQARFTAGLLVMLLAALLGIGFLSFIVTGKDDQAILEHLGLRITGENQSGKSWHYVGDCREMLNKYR